MKAVYRAALKHFSQPDIFSVEIEIVSADEIREVNKNERGVDKVTDVLSFPFLDAKNGDITVSDEDFYEGYLSLGDIVISLERAKEQAEEYGHSFEREAGFLTCHSMLHLLGYDHIDEADRAIMRKKEEEILKKLKLTRDE